MTSAVFAKNSSPFLMSVLCKIRCSGLQYCLSCLVTTIDVKTFLRFYSGTFLRLKTFLFLRFYFKDVGQWHIHIIKQQTKLTFFFCYILRLISGIVPRH